MSRKIRKVVASTLALAMMAGTVSSMPAGQFTAIINAATADQIVTSTNAAGGVKGPKVDAGSYEVKAGDTFKIKIKVTDNAEGFNALNAWLDYDKSVFEIVSFEAADTEAPDYDESDAFSFVTTNEFTKDGASANTSTLLALYSDTDNHVGDETLATVTVKVKSDAKDGYYSMAFDAKGDGGAMANRLDGNRNIVVINPTYYGASITVGNPSSEPSAPASTPASSVPSTPASTPAQTDGLTAKVADASGAAGSAIKTTLTVSGASIAGFTADLNVPSGLELTSATASGWDIEVNGKQIVALANPYQDNTSATVNLEFKASAAGSYDVSVASLAGAPKDGSKEISGTGAKGTITVSGDSQPSAPASTPASSVPTTTPSASTPNSKAIQIKIGSVSNAEAGTTVKVPVYAENIGDGFSTVQFDYSMDDSFAVSKALKGEIDGSWTVGKEQRALQFLSGNGNNINKEGKLGTIQITVPAGTANGVYPITVSNFEGSAVSKETGKQISLDASAFQGIAGAIGIGVEVEESDPTTAPSASAPASTPASPSTVPSTPVSAEVPTTVPSQGTASQPVTSTQVEGVKGPKVDAGTYKAKAGETIKIKIKVSDNADGFNALNAWLDYNKDVFEIVSFDAADIDDPAFDESDAFSFVTTNEFQKDGAAANEGTLLVLYSDTDNHVGDETLATVTVKIKEGTKDGYYTMAFDAKGDGGAMANRLDGDRKIVVINPTYYGALVQVGDVADAPSAPASTPASDKPSTPASTPASPSSVPSTPASTPVGDGIVIKIGEVTGAAGETVKVPVYAENIGDGFSTVQFDYVMDESFTISKALKGEIDGSWTVGKEQRALQFLSGNGNNIAKEGKLGTLQVVIPADAKDGVYTIELKNFEGSAVSKETGKQISLGASDFSGVTGKIIIGDVPSEEPSAPASPSASPSAPASTPASPSPSTPPTAEVPTTVPTQGTENKQPVTKTDVEGVDGPKVDAGKYEVNAGDTFKLKIKVTDNEAGFNALNAWLDYNTDIFELVSFDAADIDDPDFDESDAFSFVTVNEFKKPGSAANISTLLVLYSDTENHVGDETLATVTLKVKEGTKDGYYTMAFDAKGDGGAMANRLGDDRKITVINPTFYGALVKVGAGSGDVASPAPSTPSTPTTEPTTSTEPSETPSKDPSTKGISIKMGEVSGAPGETVKVPVYAENIGDGFSTVQFDYVIEDGFVVKKATKGEIDGSWTVGKVEKALQFLSGNGNNIDKEGILGNIQIEIPADAKPGEYTIELKNFAGSAVSKDTGKQIELDDSAFAPVAGKITVTGDVPTTEPTQDPTTEPSAPTTTEPEDGFNYDVNDDGVVNTADIISLKRFLLMVDEKAPKNGDINGDGKINTQDHVRLVKKILSK